MTEEVIFPRHLVTQMLHHAQTSPSVEVCGLIGARDGRPVSCYPVPNIADRPAMQFWLDPEGQIDAMRKMRERSEGLFAIYHSHPSAPAEPSAFDREQAAYPDTLQLIISLNTEGVLEMRGFRFREQAGTEEITLGICNT